MEKLSKNFDNILTLLLTFSLFFWDSNYLGIQFKFLILLLFIFVLRDYKEFIVKFINYKVIIFPLIFAHLYYNSDLDISFYQLKVFIFFVLISFLLVFYKDNILLNFDRSILLFNLFLVLTFIIYFFFNENYENFFSLIDFFTKTKIIFVENSHFGMISASIIIYCLNEFLSTRKKSYIVIFFIIMTLSYLNFSLTSFLGLLLSSLFLLLTNFLLLNKTQIFMFIFLIMLATVSIYFNNKKAETITVIKSTVMQEPAQKQNIHDQKPRFDLSVEVIKTSYKIMLHSIKEKSFGYGFNNYEKAFNEHINKISFTDDGRIIQEIYASLKKLNNKDGSNNFVKVVTETGLFSIIIIFLVSIFTFSKKIDLRYKLFIIPNFLVQTFIRGAGYFNGGYMIYLLLIILLVYGLRHNNKKKFNFNNL